MSIRAMVWALKDAPVPDPVAHLVLIGLADHADDDGLNARPSQRKLAEYVHVSVRTVGYKLKALESQGIIQRGDQQQVAHLRNDRRPTVWDLNLKVTHDLQNMQAVQKSLENDMQNLQTVDPDDLQTVQTVPSDDLQHLQTVQDMEDDGLQQAADGGVRIPNGLQTVADRTVLSTTNLVSSSSYLSNASEATGSITGNGESDPDRDVVVSNDLRPHTPPGAWSPSPAAWDEARAVCTTINLQLHLARYRVVKKEKKEQPSNGEWLRWAIQDETKAQEELKRQRAASRQTKTWWGVAD